VLIGFFGDQLIKNAHNPSRMGKNWSSRQIIRLRGGLSVISFLRGENQRVTAKRLAEASSTHDRIYTREGRISNILDFHFKREENVHTSCHTSCKIW